MGALTTLRRRLPATWAAVADGVLDWPRARAIAAELGWPARETPDDVARRDRGGGGAAGDRAVDQPAAGAGPGRADRRRSGRGRPAAEQGARAADVTVHGLGDGMAELRATMPLRRRPRCARWPTRTPAR